MAHHSFRKKTIKLLFTLLLIVNNCFARKKLRFGLLAGMCIGNKIQNNTLIATPREPQLVNIIDDRSRFGSFPRCDLLTNVQYRNQVNTANCQCSISLKESYRKVQELRVIQIYLMTQLLLVRF